MIHTYRDNFEIYSNEWICPINCHGNLEYTVTDLNNIYFETI